MKKLRLFTALAACTIALSPAITTLTSSSNTVLAAKKPKRAKRAKHKKRHLDASYYFGSAYKKPYRTVYIDIPADNHLYQATLDAMKGWNDTGTFTFKQTDNKKKANIIVHTYYKANVGRVGYTETNQPMSAFMIPVKHDPRWDYFKAGVYLNHWYLDHGDDFSSAETRSIVTAEHELGHAIGLKHSDDIHSVMFPDALYTINHVDVQAVKKLYHEN